MGVTGALLLRKDVKITSIFAETFSSLPDSRAAAKVISVLDQYLGLKVDYKPLIEKAEKFETKIKDLLSKSKDVSLTAEKKKQSYFGWYLKEFSCLFCFYFSKQGVQIVMLILMVKEFLLRLPIVLKKERKDCSPAKIYVTLVACSLFLKKKEIMDSGWKIPLFRWTWFLLILMVLLWNCGMQCLVLRIVVRFILRRNLRCMCWKQT